MTNVTDHGAIGDGRTLNTIAIQKAVDACAAAGGGRVVVPSGVFVSGPIFLKSNIEFHVGAGAVLRGDPDMKAYGQVELRTHGHYLNAFQASLITAVQAENVSVTGTGTLDGNGKVWWDEIDAGRPGPRPVLVYFLDCERVLLEGVKLLNSPAWTVLPLLCRNVSIRGITIQNPWKPYHNCDGIDIHSCRDVRVSDCHIDTGDDGICLKSIPDWFISAGGSSASGWMKVDYSQPRIPCENVVIDNCVVTHAHSGVSAWAEVIGGLGNLAVTNCVFDGTRTGIQIARYPWPGGYVRDCTFDNIIMRRVECGFQISSQLWPWDKLNDGPEMETTPDIGNIRISNVTGTKVMVACEMYGMEKNPVHDVTFSNIRMESNLGFNLRNVRNVYFDNVEVTCQNVPLVVKDAVNVEFRRFNAAASSSQIPVIEVERVRDSWVHGCSAAPGTGVFLGEVGAGNDVRLDNNRLAQARQERAAVPEDNAWNICSHAYSGSRWIRDSGDRNLWLPLPEAVSQFVRARWTPEQVDRIFSISRVEANARPGAEVRGPSARDEGRGRGTGEPDTRHSTPDTRSQEERRRIYIVEAHDVLERLVVFEDGELLRVVENPNFHAHFEQEVAVDFESEKRHPRSAGKRAL
jgi:hypothetical protein